MKAPTIKLIHILEGQLRALKGTYRDPKLQPPSAETYRALHEAKHLATFFCVMTAQARGRVHFAPIHVYGCGGLKAPMSLEQQAEWLAKHSEKVAARFPQLAA